MHPASFYVDKQCLKRNCVLMTDFKYARAGESAKIFIFDLKRSPVVVGETSWLPTASSVKRRVKVWILMRYFEKKLL